MSEKSISIWKQGSRPGRGRGSLVPALLTRAASRASLQAFGVLIVSIVALLLAPGSAHALPAFPGAEGFGANAVGGRGGRVIEVTNLNDSGPGSLRAAVETVGPRIVVFRIGGTIELRSSLRIANPFITMAGQTAPGGGIALKNHPSNTKSTIIVDTHDVVIRYLRVRPGPSTSSTDVLDAIEVKSGFNTIIDHCSLSWAVDENANVWYDTSKVTFQWNIISEALHDSVHPKGPHSKGMLLGSAGSHSMSIHHNLFVHDYNRTPQIKTSGTVDVVNNVSYNWGSSGDGAAAIEDDYGKQPINFVGNYFKKGPNTGTYYELRYFPETNVGAILYLQGNIGPHRPDETYPQSAIAEASLHPYIVSVPNPAPPITTTSAAEAFTMVLANAGATLPQRDPVDERILNDVRNGTGRIINHPDEVGGWPVLAMGTPPVDTDHDGMPDAWEAARGLDSTRDDSAGDRDGDGYTNIEEYLNSLVAGTPSDTVPPAAPASLLVR